MGQVKICTIFLSSDTFKYKGLDKIVLRAKHRDTPPLQFNQQLCEDAQNYAEKLASTGQRGHDEAELNQKGNFYLLVNIYR